MTEIDKKLKNRKFGIGLYLTYDMADKPIDEYDEPPIPYEEITQYDAFSVCRVGPEVIEIFGQEKMVDYILDTIDSLYNVYGMDENYSGSNGFVGASLRDMSETDSDIINFFTEIHHTLKKAADKVHFGEYPFTKTIDDKCNTILDLSRILSMVDRVERKIEDATADIDRISSLNITIMLDVVDWEDIIKKKYPNYANLTFDRYNIYIGGNDDA